MNDNKLFSKKLKRLLPAAVVLVVFYISTLVYYLAISNNRLSDSAEVHDFAFCEVENPEQKLYLINLHELERDGAVNLCGYLTTNGQPVNFAIYVFYESRDKPVFMNKGGAIYSPGFFTESIRSDFLSRPGTYSAEVHFQRNILASTLLHIVDPP